MQIPPIKIKAIELAKKGYYGGDVDKIMNIDYKTMQDIIAYEDGIEAREQYARKYSEIMNKK